jgi:hypothetical protein
MKTPDVTKAEFLSAVQQGVLEAVREALPDKDEILNTITYGVDGAMPYAEMILTAITDGVKEAMRVRKGSNVE